MLQEFPCFIRMFESVCVCESGLCCVCVCVCNHGGGVIAVYWSPAAWCLRNEGVSSVLLGASNTDQLMENIGAIQVRPQNVCACACVFCVCTCLSSCRANQRFNLWRCDLTAFIRPPLYSCLTVRNSSLISWVQLGLSGSLLPHAWVLYCTELIRSAEYQLPGGLKTGSRPLPLLLIRCTLLMGFSDWWGFTSSPHIVWPEVFCSIMMLFISSYYIYLCMCESVSVHTLVY